MEPTMDGHRYIRRRCCCRRSRDNTRERLVRALVLPKLVARGFGTHLHHDYGLAGPKCPNCKTQVCPLVCSSRSCCGICVGRSWIRRLRTSREGPEVFRAAMREFVNFGTSEFVRDHQSSAAERPVRTSSWGSETRFNRWMQHLLLGLIVSVRRMLPLVSSSQGSFEVAY